jgi:hypothetical protein
MVLLVPPSADSSEAGPVLVSQTISGSSLSGRTLNLSVREKSSRFRDGDLLHVLLDNSPLEAVSPRDGLFSIVIPHLSGQAHRVSLRFSRKDQTEWGSELLVTLPAVSSSGEKH